MSYNQITQEERYQIYSLLKVGNNQIEITMILNRYKSMISRVIRRNKGLRGYRPKQAQRLADQRKNDKAYSRIRLFAVKYRLLLIDQENGLALKRLIKYC